MEDKYYRGLKIIRTVDGSPTVYSDLLDETYHSLFGAIQESIHVFIQAGFRFATRGKSAADILEVGLGTGLNVFLTLLESEQMEISYTAIEPYPLPETITEELDYPQLTGHPEASGLFSEIHRSPWEVFTEIRKGFQLKKMRTTIQQAILPGESFDVIYFDAFSPGVQPEMWTSEIFSGLFAALRKGGVLVTYSAMGMVKQHLRNAGFLVERLPGAAGKRHMVRAIRP